MTDIKAKLRVDMDGNVLSQARRYADEINRFSVSVTRNLRRVRTEAALSGADFHPFGPHVGALRTDIGALTSAIHALTGALGQNTSHLEQNSMNLGQNSSQLDRNADQLNRNSRALGRYRREADQAGNASRRMQRAGSRFAGLATGLGGAVAAGAFLQKDIELEDAMLQVRSNLVGGAKDAEDLDRQLKKVKTTARELAETTGFSDASMALLVNQMLKSGIKGQDTHGPRGAAAGAAGLSKLGDVSYEEASSALGATASAFGMNGAQLYDFADFMVKADDASGQSTAKLLYNWQQANAGTGLLHLEPKKIIAGLAYGDTLMNEGGTAMARLLENLAAPTKQKHKAMVKSGMDFWDEDKKGNVKIKPPEEIFAIIRKRYRGMKDEQKMIVELHRIFGEEGGKLAALIASKPLSFADFYKHVEQSTGMQEKLAIRSTGLGVAFERLEHSVISVAADAFEPLGESIKGVVNYLNDTVNGAKKPLDSLAPGSMKSPGAGNPVKDMLLDVRHSVNSGGYAVGDGLAGLVHGLASTLGLAPERPMFPGGELPMVEITLKNQSDQPLKLGGATTKGGGVTLSNERAGPHFP